MRNFTLLLLTLIIAGGTVQTTEAQIFKSKKKKAEAADTTKKTPPPSKYERMFVKDKSVVTAKSGFITVHKAKGKLYFELPAKYLERDMLLATTVSQTSDAAGVVMGYKHKDPMHIRFMQMDSTIYMTQVCLPLGFDPEYHGSVEEAVKSNSLDPILSSFKIVCMNGDAAVLDVTNTFLGGDPKLSPLDEGSSYIRYNNVFRNDASALAEFKAFDDNVTVKSYMSYSISASLMGMVQLMTNEPVTIKVTRTLLLLPEQEKRMRPRVADSRVGIFLSNKTALRSDEDKIVDYSVIHRWNLQPKDTAAFLRGELTEPVKPIVFYLDDAFPDSWRAPAREGVLRWNDAFEKIGFKDAVQVLDYPKDDPEFDPDNLKYSCIRYVPIPVANAMGPSWVDPQTGEIINASVIVYNDLVKLLNYWRFVQTAQVDRSVRAKKLPDDIMYESIAYVLAHEVGHCLGFMHNMAASSAYTVESLRDPGFTQKNGTTPSIMDYARFNYVAQPGDTGVRLTPPDLGPYDYYLVKYAYAPLFEVNSTEEERPILEKWVDVKAGDPVYRYGRQQIMARYDPSSIEEDLGDDAMKAGDYGIKNLKYILSNLNYWIPNDTDPDASHRRALYSNIISQYGRYIRAVLMNVGGIYLTDVKPGTPGETYKAVPKDRQREALGWVLKQLKDSEWLYDKDVVGNFDLMLSQASVFRYNMVREVFSVYQKVMLSSHVSDNPYTVKEYFDDLYTVVWESAIKGRPTTEADRQLQALFIETAAGILDKKSNGVIIVGSVSSDEAYAPSVDHISSFRLDETGVVDRYIDILREIEEREGRGFVARGIAADNDFGYGYGWQGSINLRSIDNSKTLFHSEANRILTLLKYTIGGTSGDTRAHYQAMIFALERAMSAK